MRNQILLTIVALALVAGPASGRTWYVKPDSTGDAATIVAALDSAACSDTVLVAAGTYYRERALDLGYGTYAWIIMKDGVSLVSEEGAQATALVETAPGLLNVLIYGRLLSGVAIEGFTFRLEAMHASRGGAPFQHHDTAVTISGCDISVCHNIIHGFETGIEAAGGCEGEPVIANNHITGCSFGLGLYSGWPLSPLVVDNLIEDCYIGIYGPGCTAWIRSNLVSGSTFCGLYLVDSSNCMIWNNTIRGSSEYAVYAHLAETAACVKLNGSGNPANGNNIYDSGWYDVYFENESAVGAFDASLNYWGSDCPDLETRIYGPVTYSPWTDATHSSILSEEDCPEAAEPATWGAIKAMYRR